MNRTTVLLATILTSVTFINNAWSMLISSDDLWDVSNGTTITDNSPLHAASRSEASSMFGYYNTSNLYNEGENTLFSDRQVDNFVHFVEWETASPVMVNSFNLVASHGPEPQYSKNDRGFKTFNLYYLEEDSSEWDLLYSYETLNPYGGGDNYPDTNYLELFGTFDSVTAQQFRAEFIQFGRRDINTVSAGPRIHELDGYYNVPEPTTLSLTALGLIGLTRHRRKVSK